jgi:hypothetical protein
LTIVPSKFNLVKLLEESEIFNSPVKLLRIISVNSVLLVDSDVCEDVVPIIHNDDVAYT